jgi:hypothetical protein
VAVALFSGVLSGGTPAASAYGYGYGNSGSVTGSGTIASPVRGQVSFDLSAKQDSTGATGSCTVVEPATKTKVKCLGVTSITFDQLTNGCKRATLNGPATINGTSTTYEIQATDCGTPGTGNDSFSIQTGTGYHRSGVLTSGNLNVKISS